MQERRTAALCVLRGQGRTRTGRGRRMCVRDQLLRSAPPEGLREMNTGGTHILTHAVLSVLLQPRTSCPLLVADVTDIVTSLSVPEVEKTAMSLVLAFFSVLSDKSLALPTCRRLCPQRP